MNPHDWSLVGGNASPLWNIDKFYRTIGGGGAAAPGGEGEPEGVRVLLTNGSLVNRAGSELYLLEVATRLLSLGHSPVASLADSRAARWLSAPATIVRNLCMLNVRSPRPTRVSA